MAKKPSLSKAAKTFGVSSRTVANWKSQGAPVDDPVRLRSWLASRRQPPRFAAGPKAQPASRPPKPAAPHEHVLGAAAALKRLEEIEAADYAAMLTAIESGDDLLARVKRDGWLRSSEALRRYDLAVEQNRRASGELIPRADVARMLSTFGLAVRFGFLGAFESLCPALAAAATPVEVWSRLHKTVQDLPLTIAAGLRQYQPPLPEGLVADFEKGFSTMPRDDQWAEHFANIIGKVMATCAASDLEEFRRKGDVEKRWRECTDPIEKSRIWHEELNADLKNS